MGLLNIMVLLLRAHQHHILSEKLLLGPKQHVQHSFPNQARVKDLHAGGLPLGKRPAGDVDWGIPSKPSSCLHMEVCAAGQELPWQVKGWADRGTS